MSDIDFSKMSDQQLLAYIHTNQPGPSPVQADSPVGPVAPPEPVQVTDLPALPKPQAPNAGDRALAAVGHGVNAVASGVPVLGAYADEADAATAAGLAPVLEPTLRHAPHLVQAIMGYDARKDIGDLPTFGQRYDAARNLQRFDADAFHKAHPKTDTGLKIGGAIAGTVAMLPALAAGTIAAGPEAGVLARAGIGAVEGAGIGGADRYGRGDGGLTDQSRIHGAEMGAGIGSVAGAVLPIASAVAGTAYRNSAGRIVDAIRGSRTVQAPATEEASRLARILTEANPQASVMKPDRSDLESALVTAQRSPLAVRASNVDDAYVRLARAADRQKMTPAEMAQAVREKGPFATLADTGEATRDLLRAAVNRPGRGATIAEENLTPRQNGVFDPDTGQWTVRPSSMRVTDQAQAGLGLEGKDFHSEIDNLLAQRKAASGPAYDKAYEAQPVDIGELRDFAGSPMFKEAYGRARAISQKEFVKLPDGTEIIQPLPEKFSSNGSLDWRTLDLMKQGMQDTISEAKRQGIGANDQGATKQFLTRFVGKLDSLNPDYATARAAFSGPTAMKDALEEGRSLLSEDAPTVATNIAGRPESERQMLRLGALQALQTKLGNANVTFDAASQAGLLKPNQLARFQALFPTKSSFADFYRTMQNEKTMFATNKAAFGNSTTAKQLLNVMEPSDPQIEGISQAVPAAMSANPIALVRALHRMGMESPMREGVAETIASVLSSHNAENLGGVVSKMQAAQRAAVLADTIRRSNGSAAGMGASAAVGRGQ